MNIFDDDRPEGYDEEKDGKARIRPEHLGPAEKLKMDAEDIEAAVEHFGDENGPEVTGAQSAP